MSFLARAIVPVAVAPASGGPKVVLPPAAGHGLRARSAINRLTVRDVETRECINALLGALCSIEQETEDLRHRMLLAGSGIALKPELVAISPAELQLQRELGFGDGTRVVVHLDLIVWQARRLLTLDGNVVDGPDGLTIEWTNLSQEERDVLVGFVFQEQSRERRRALDRDGH